MRDQDNLKHLIFDDSSLESNDSSHPSSNQTPSSPKPNPTSKPVTNRKKMIGEVENETCNDSNEMEKQTQLYWERRKRNNEAAKRSRDLKKMREKYERSLTDRLKSQNVILAHRCHVLMAQNESLRRAIMNSNCNALTNASNQSLNYRFALANSTNTNKPPPTNATTPINDPTTNNTNTQILNSTLDTTNTTQDPSGINNTNRSSNSSSTDSFLFTNSITQSPPPPPTHDSLLLNQYYHNYDVNHNSTTSRYLSNLPSTSLDSTSCLNGSNAFRYNANHPNSTFLNASQSNHNYHNVLRSEFEWNDNFNL